MSLFGVKEIWTTDAIVDEEFVCGGLCVNSLGGKDVKILCGSVRGVLRVFNPRTRQFKHDDQLMVVDTQAPILQISVGRFTAAAAKTVVVLHPRSVQLFEVDVFGDTVMHSHWRQFSIPRSVANMTVCDVDGRQGINVLCIQSLDGEIYFLEKDRLVSVGRHWQKHLIPGPVLWIADNSTFVTSTADFEVVCYSYASLNTPQTQNQNAAVRWKFDVGELVSALSRCELNTPSAIGHAIACLGDRSLSYVSLNGCLLLHMRFDDIPLNLCVFPFQSPNHRGRRIHNTLVTTHEGNWRVYCGARLLWMAKSKSRPVAVTVSKIDDLDGLIITMDKSGRLALSYLGTRPNLDLSPPEEGDRIDYPAINAEYRMLKAKLKRDEALEDGETDPSAISIRAIHPETEISQPLFNTASEVDTLDEFPLHLKITCIGPPRPIADIDLLIIPPSGLSVDEDSWTVSILDPGDSNSVTIPLRFSKINSDIDSHSCLVIASYKDEKEILRVYQHPICLPILLLFKLIPPLKEAQYKMVMESELPSVSLQHLFGDIIEEQRFHHQLNACVLTFQSSTGEHVTIISSKSASRYRIQSDDLPSLRIGFLELESRLGIFRQQLDEKHVSMKSVIRPTDDPSVEMVLEMAEARMTCRNQMTALEESLKKNMELYRIIQKRRLSKYKSHLGGAMDHLEALHEEVFQKLRDQAGVFDDLSTEMAQLNSRVITATSILIDLLRLRHGLSEETVQILKSTLLVTAADRSAEWEVEISQSIHHALRRYFTQGEETDRESCLKMKAVSIKDAGVYLAEFCSQIQKHGGVSVSGSKESVSFDLLKEDV